MCISLLAGGGKEHFAVGALPENVNELVFTMDLSLDDKGEERFHEGHEIVRRLVDFIYIWADTVVATPIAVELRSL